MGHFSGLVHAGHHFRRGDAVLHHVGIVKLIMFGNLFGFLHLTRLDEEPVLRHLALREMGFDGQVKRQGFGLQLQRRRVVGNLKMIVGLGKRHKSDFFPIHHEVAFLQQNVVNGLEVGIGLFAKKKAKRQLTLALRILSKSTLLLRR